MQVLLLISLFAGIATAHAKTVPLDSEKGIEWREGVHSLLPGDNILVDKLPFSLGDELGAGSYGRVFETEYESKRVAIKLQLDPKAVSSNPDHQVGKQAAQFQSLAEKGIPVPEIYLGPADRPYLVMQLIGRENWHRKSQTFDTTTDRLEGFLPVIDLLVKFEVAKLMPKDRKNLAKNIVLSENNAYYVVDPGGVSTVSEHVGLPMEVALQTLRPREAALSFLMVFERLARDGYYRREFPKALLERKAIVQESPDPLWVVAYLLWARESHHMTPREFIADFQEKFKFSHPALLLSEHTDWKAVPPETKRLAADWIAAEAKEVGPLFFDPLRSREAGYRARLFAFHPWQNDMRFATLAFRELRTEQKQEALDQVSFARRTDVLHVLAPYFCAVDISDQN